MKAFYLLKNLNDKQREAVTSSRVNMLILAGAGSGKTRVIVHRIAWLLTVNKVSPLSIMAVTFTNKAAAEMRHRIDVLLGNDLSSFMWVGTFHGLAHRLLRTHYLDINLPQNFQILDSNDQYHLLCRIIKTLNLGKNKLLPRQVMFYINTKKNEGLKPQYIKSYNNPTEVTWLQVYRHYQKICDQAGLVDFAELLLRAHELWKNKPRILQHYQDRFTNILIDEFQDTNSIQYSWIHALASKASTVMAVGDDDQSIYGWRGAQVKNIQRFLQDFTAVETIRMEQNYRSTNNILKSANALIANNNNRLKKNLWTDGDDGEPISLYCGVNALDEARYVVDSINRWHKKGGALKECAILYRKNIQSRALEEVLLQFSIPYRIYGTQSFFERQEIKNALSYLRLVVNHNDDLSFERVVNTPTRGIGKRTLEVIRQEAHKKQLTFWESCEYLLREKIFDTRVVAAIKDFLELINILTKEIIGMSLGAQIERVILDSGLRGMYELEKNEKGRARIENLEELITAAHQFYYQEDDKNLIPLQRFLSYVALESGEEMTSLDQDAVQLMTIHSAKGLEFPLVFIVGMEEGVFPSKINIEENEQLAEERRLAYVGLTRAMKKLTLTYAKNSRIHGKEMCHHPSRFIAELPAECVKDVRLRSTILNQINCKQPLDTIINKNSIISYSNYTLGQLVSHPKFGKGTIIGLRGDGEHCYLQISFKDSGIKWLVATYVKLVGLQ